MNKGEAIPNAYRAIVSYDYNVQDGEDASASLVINNIKKVRIELAVNDGSGESTPKYSSAVSLTKKDIRYATLTVTGRVGSGVFEADLKVTPAYKVDDGCFAKFFYMEDSIWIPQEWQETQTALSYDSATKSMGAICHVEGLYKETYQYLITYKYYITVFGKSYGSAQQPKKFTLQSVINYTDRYFPDEVFRDFIKTKLGIKDEKPITSADLERLTELRCPRNEKQENISSIDGIEYMPNLTSIDFTGHNLEYGAANRISGLTRLKHVRFAHNNLGDLPDMSKMAGLVTAEFDDNEIPTTNIQTSQLPQGFLKSNPTWIENTKKTQRESVKYELADKYYAVGAGADKKRPFLIKVTGLNKDANRTYTLSLSYAIGDKTVSVSKLSFNSQDIYCIPDITSIGIPDAGGTLDRVKVKMTDSYGNTWLNTEKSLTFAAGGKDMFAEPVYVSPGARECSLIIREIPADVKISDITNIILKSPWRDVGEADLSGLTDKSFILNINPYEDVFGNFSSDISLTGGKSLSVPMKLSYTLDQNCDAVITIKDKPYTLEDAVIVPWNAYLGGLSAYTGSGTYDNSGDYWHVRLSGANIDPSKVRPVFYDGSKAITAFVSSVSMDEGRAAVYKLKKLEKDKYWRESGYKTFRIAADSGYVITDAIKDKTVYYTLPSDEEDAVLFEYYDSQSKSFKVKLNQNILNNTQVTVSVSESNDEPENVAATAAGTVKSGWLSLAFKDNDDNPYSLTDKQLTFRYSCTYGGKTRTFEHSAYIRDDSSGFASDYSPDEYLDGSKGYESPLKNLNVDVTLKGVSETSPTAQIYQVSDTASDEPKGEAAMTKKGGTLAGGWQIYTVSWSDASGLGEGEYEIKYGDQIIYRFYVYNAGTFYMRGQSVRKWVDDDGLAKCIEVSFSSENLAAEYAGKNRIIDGGEAYSYWYDNGYNVEIFNSSKQRIDIGDVVDFSWSKDAFRVRVGDATTATATGCYVRITKNGKTGKALGTDKDCYTFWNENSTYGKWHTLGDRIYCRVRDNNGINTCYGIGSDILESYPLTVTLTLPYDVEPKAKFTAQKPSPKKFDTDTGREYYFTAANLKGIDPKTIYKIRVTDKNGKVLYDGGMGYFGIWTGADYKPPVDGVYISDDKYRFWKKGERVQLSAEVSPAETANKKINWSTSDSKVATVSTTGLVTATGAGTAVITASAAANPAMTATCIMTVVDYKISSDNITINKLVLDKTLKPTTMLTVTGKAEGDTVEWESSNPNIATIDKESGLITAKAVKDGVGNSTTTITAMIYANTEDRRWDRVECEVTVTNNVLDISLNKTACRLDISGKVSVAANNKTEQLYVGYTPNDTTLSRNITWTSSDSKVATVSREGLVTAQKAGRATITAESINGKTATCNVTVVDYKISNNNIAINKLALDKTSKPTATLTVTGAAEGDTVTWSNRSIYDRIVSIDQNGLVTAKNVGTTYITAEVKGGDSVVARLACDVTITNNVLDSITMNKKECRLNMDKTLSPLQDETNLWVTFTPDDTTMRDITWTSSDSKVATVSSYGLVTAKKAGTAKITAKSSTGKTATCDVTVVDYKISSQELALDRTSRPTAQLSITGKAAKDEVVWSVERGWWTADEKTATVDQNGKVTAQGVGRATIIAEVYNGSTRVDTFSCDVTVTNNALTAIALDDKVLRLSPSDKSWLCLTFTPDDTTLDRDIKWTNSNPAVVTLSDTQLRNGIWTASVTASETKVGTATITAKSKNGKTASCSVIVTDYKIDGGENGFDFELDLRNEDVSKRSRQLTVTNGGRKYTNVAWSSSDTKVATVDQYGKVAAAGEGTATITAAVKEGSKAVETFTCNVTVVNNWLALSETELTLDKSSNSSKTLKLNCNNPGVIQSVEWSSSDSNIASVSWSSSWSSAEKLSKSIEAANSLGEAVITATAKLSNGRTVTRTCQVTVMSVTEKSDADNAAKWILSPLTALTNVQPKLKDVELPDVYSGSGSGWEWVNPELSLASFSGGEPKNFVVRYYRDYDAYKDAPANEKKYYVPSETVIPIQAATVTGVKIDAKDCGILNKAAERTGGTLRLGWIVNNENLIKEIEKRVQIVTWTVKDNNVIKLLQYEPVPEGKEPNDKTAYGNSVYVYLKDGVKKGSAVVTLNAYLKGVSKPYTASYTVNVVNGAVAKIKIPDGSGKDISSLDIDLANPANKTVTVTANVTNATALTATSSDANIASVGRVTGAAVPDANPKMYNFTIPLTVKAAGEVQITLTANDAEKTSKTIELSVTDPIPKISADTLTINLQKKDGEKFYLYPHDGYIVQSVEANPVYREGKKTGTAAPFTLEGDGTDTRRYKVTVKANGAAASATPYKLNVKVTVKKQQQGAEAALPLNILVVNTKPGYTVKQTGKVNLFYTSGREAELIVTSKETIEEVTLADTKDKKGNEVKCAFKIEKGKGENAGKYYIKVDTEKAGYNPATDTAGKLAIFFNNYEKAEQDFTVSVENKAPTLKLGSTAATLYPSVDTAVISVTKDGKPWTLDDSVNVSSKFYKSIGGKSTEIKDNIGVEVTKNNGKLLISGAGRLTALTRAESLSLKINIKGADWSGEVQPLAYTLNLKPGTPALKLSKTTLKLNTAFWEYDAAQTRLTWDGTEDFDDSKIEIEDNNALKTKNVLANSVKFEYNNHTITARLLRGDIPNGTYKFKIMRNGAKVKDINVTVVNDAPDKAITLSQTGSIDVLDRQNTFVTVTPSFRSLNGTVGYGRNPELIGGDAYAFEIAKVENGKVFIKAKEDAKLITGYEYKIRLKLYIYIAGGGFITYETPAKTPIKLRLKQSKPKVTITPKTNAVFFSGISAYKTFTVKSTTAEIAKMELQNCVEMFEASEYSNGEFTIYQYRAAKGKTYKLKFKVTFKGHADNEQPTIVEYSVQVK